jgi:hypothetical protein
MLDAKRGLILAQKLRTFTRVIFVIFFLNQD